DLLDACMIGIGIGAGQDGITNEPIKISTLSSAAAPFVYPPGTVSAGVFVTLILALRIIDVSGTVSEVDNLSARSGFGGSSGRKLALIKIVDLHGGAIDEDSIRARDPSEPRMAEQFVISSQCGQIVPPGIAVSLRIEDFCIFSV